MNDAFQGIIGHGAQREYLANVLKNGTVSHAYGFTGPAGVGKQKVAYAFAAALLGVTEQTLMAHPDVVIVDYSIHKKTKEVMNVINIDDIRELNEKLALSTFSGGRRVAIIKVADKMTPAAQNALLKTLEEPRAKTVIVLVAESLERLLPTIRSRMTHVRFLRVPRAVLLEVFVNAGFDREAAHRLAGRANGRPGEAVRLLDAEYRREREEEMRGIEGALKGSAGEQLRAFEGRTKKVSKPELYRFLDDWLAVAHDGMLHAGEAAAWSAAETEGEGRQVRAWAAMLKRIEEARSSVEQNGSTQLAIGHIVFE